jgi:hypothetical protein
MSEELIQAVSASAGGMASTLLLFPLDVIKTKMQASRRAAAEGHGKDGDDISSSCNISASSSALDVAGELLKRSGVRPFFNGVGPGLVQSGIEKGVYFYAYTFLK